MTVRPLDPAVVDLARLVCRTCGVECGVDCSHLLRRRR